MCTPHPDPSDLLPGLLPPCFFTFLVCFNEENKIIPLNLKSGHVISNQNYSPSRCPSGSTQSPIPSRLWTLLRPPTPSPALSSEPLPVLCHPSGTLFPTVGRGQSLFFPGPSTNVIIVLVRSFLAVAFKDSSPLFWEAPFPFLQCPCNHLAKINEVHLCICIVCAFIMCCPSLEHKP